MTHVSYSFFLLLKVLICLYLSYLAIQIVSSFHMFSGEKVIIRLTMCQHHDSLKLTKTMIKGMYQYEYTFTIREC